MLPKVEVLPFPSQTIVNVDLTITTTNFPEYNTAEEIRDYFVVAINDQIDDNGLNWFSSDPTIGGNWYCVNWETTGIQMVYNHPTLAAGVFTVGYQQHLLNNSSNYYYFYISHNLFQ